MKKYICHPEFISRDFELKDGSNTNKLYELEVAAKAFLGREQNETHEKVVE